MPGCAHYGGDGDQRKSIHLSSGIPKTVSLLQSVLARAGGRDVFAVTVRDHASLLSRAYFIPEFSAPVVIAWILLTCCRQDGQASDVRGVAPQNPFIQVSLIKTPQMIPWPAGKVVDMVVLMLSRIADARCPPSERPLPDV